MWVKFHFFPQLFLKHPIKVKGSWNIFALICFFMCWGTLFFLSLRQLWLLHWRVHKDDFFLKIPLRMNILTHVWYFIILLLFFQNCKVESRHIPSRNIGRSFFVFIYFSYGELAFSLYILEETITTFLGGDQTTTSHLLITWTLVRLHQKAI